MKKSAQILSKIRLIAGVKTDKELAEKFGINYGTIDSWRVRDKIPAKRLLEFSEKLGVSMDILVNGDINGSNNVIFKGDGNTVNGYNSHISDEILKEFCELYEAHNTPQIQKELKKLVEILRKVKAAYDTSL